MNKELDSRFEQILGKAPSETEKLYLYRIKDALKLSDDDGIWMIFFGLSYVLSFYEKIPNNIEKERKLMDEAMTFKTSSMSKLVEKYVVTTATDQTKRIVEEVVKNDLNEFRKEITKLVMAAKLTEKNNKKFKVSHYLITTFITISSGVAFAIGGLWLGISQPDLLAHLINFVGGI